MAKLKYWNGIEWIEASNVNIIKIETTICDKIDITSGMTDEISYLTKPIIIGEISDTILDVIDMSNTLINLTSTFTDSVTHTLS